MNQPNAKVDFHVENRLEMLDTMSKAFGSSSGTYNVRASELTRDKKLTTVVANVIFLDETQQVFHIPKKSKGIVLLDLVFQHLELIERDYFGLQFTENGSPPTNNNIDITRWLEENKSIKKQAGGVPVLWLAVRFYPPEPSRLAEEYTKYLLCLQIRKLILDGRMSAPHTTELLLASFVVQAEVGDYNPNEHSQSYISGLQLLSKQTPDDEAKIRELHKLHKGQTPAEAELNYLEHAKRLPCYGLHSHPAKDSHGKDIEIGVTCDGLVILQNDIAINTFSWAKIVKLTFKKKQFFIQIKREPCESYDTVLGFNMRSARAAKSLWRTGVEQHSFFRLAAPPRPRLARILAALAPPPRAPRATHAQALARRAPSMHRVFVRAPSVRGTTVRAVVSPGAGRRGGRVTSRSPPAPRRAWQPSSMSSPPAPHTPPPTLTVHAQSSDKSDDDDDEGGFLSRAAARVPYADDSDASTAPSLVTVRLAPGADGRFGFNVRAGRPLRVARVAVHTPAYRADPPLRQGDEVVSINGIDVEDLTHEEIVQMIRGTKGILTLTIRPNGGCEERYIEEPEARFVPLEPEAMPASSSPSAQSLLLLGDGLASGAALAAYDLLPRRSTYEPRPHHPRDRYRDITPYEETRVVLKNCPSGDYINASYINMEIPHSNLVLTYIATQGPLAATVGDFWQMMWECGSTLVVMLTVVLEGGRAKCHQYWPNEGEVLNPNTRPALCVTLQSEIEEGDRVYRKILVANSVTGESRVINQLQYLAWPDHGVPTNSSSFIHFTMTCSKLRQPSPEGGGLPPPMVVHCSAGVGRTGALVLAEVALELLRRRQPVYPLDLVRHMRAQRPCCIQNATQYKFVCESILSAYHQGLIPIDDMNENETT